MLKRNDSISVNELALLQGKQTEKSINKLSKKLMQ